MNRTGSVVRLYLASRRSVLLPLALSAGAAAAITIGAGLVARFAAASPADLAEMNQGMQWSGAIWAVLGPITAIAGVAMTQSLDLALGLSLTRREYARGTAMVLGLVAAVTSVIITVLKAVEQATNGWGLRVRMFDVVWVNTGQWWQTAVQSLLLVCVLLAITGAIAGVHRRWRGPGVFLALGGLTVLALLIGALAMVATSVRDALVSSLSWPWQGWMGVLLLLAALLTTACLALIRRAEVR